MKSSRFALIVPITIGVIVPVLWAYTDMSPNEPATTNALTTALWFCQQESQPAALVPNRDRQLKLKLTSALSKSRQLPWDAVKECFDKSQFRKLAVDSDTISVEQMQRIVQAKTPQSRQVMHAKTRQHCDLLTTQFDLIEDQHRGHATELVSWIVQNYQPGQPLGIIIICTGNTRRSMLGATMGNLAASYYGLTDVRFFSGGTEPDAINPRTVATLKDIGIEIEATGQEAERGGAGHANPIYRVKWGRELETREFSKKYSDSSNPQSGFAAILVCGEADESCPQVAGASVRIPATFLDPKSYDGTAFESAKYAERRDDMGRFMLNVMMQARRQLDLAGKLK